MSSCAKVPASPAYKPNMILPRALSDLRDRLALDMRNESLPPSSHDAYSPSLSSHAMNLRANQAHTDLCAPVPINLFVPASHCEILNCDAFSSTSSLVCSSDEEDASDFLITEGEGVDGLIKDCKNTGWLKSASTKVGVFDKDTWAPFFTTSSSLSPSASRGIQKSSTPLNISCWSASGEEGEVAEEDRNWDIGRPLSVQKTPSGTLHVKGFSAGIGQHGISIPSAPSSPAESPSPCCLLPSAAAALLPMRDRLVVLTKLGQGASGIVYKAFDISRLQLVALKTVRIFDKDKRHQMVRELNTLFSLLRRSEPREADRSETSTTASSTEEIRDHEVLSGERQCNVGDSWPGFRKSSSNSGRGACQCSGGFREYPHQHIVEFYDAFSEVEEAVVLVMEYMDGGSAQDLTEMGGCAREEVLASLAAQTLSGLAYLHQRHQIHRDIKPANLLLNLSGDVKISDMGLLRDVDVERDTDHLVHTYIGTITYMSPERLDSRAYSYSCDIWSLGMAMLTVSFGELPSQVQGGYWSILTNIREHSSPALSDDPDSSHCWSDEYRDFIAQCLRKDPQERPSARELLQHPFLLKHPSAPEEEGRREEVEQLGVRELKSIVQCLYCHLKELQSSAFDLFFVLREPTTPKAADADHTLSTLDIFNLTVVEMLKFIMFNELPPHVLQRIAELRADLAAREGDVHVSHHFHESSCCRCCDCYCCTECCPVDPGGECEEYKYSGRLVALAVQLHLPVNVVMQTARECVDLHCEFST